MAKLVMRRKSTNNVYFHPDFHIATNIMLEYIETNYGKKGVKEYLRQFASTYYRPLKMKIKKYGLKAIKDYIEQLYRKENGKIELFSKENSLTVKVKKCPAVSHIRKKIPVTESFYETTKTVYETILQGTNFEFELTKYDKKTGKAILIFGRKK